ncbi:LigA protein, partial [Streptomyces himastatinicus ATCC 53653]
GGARGLQHLAEVPGRCTGGAWLDRMGRLLALDRELDGRTKTLVVDLGRGGETSPLLQITERSNDRLLLADPDSGLLLVRSDAPGDERLGWGVLGSTLPVRFPDCLRPPAQATATPFAIQPGQMLTPEACAVAFRIDAPAGGRPWVGVWRPSERRLRQFSAPEGWLAGSGLWSRDGELWLPYATRQVPCGLARVWLPEATAPRASAGSPAAPRVIRRAPRPAREPEVSGITPWRKVSGEAAVTHAGAVPHAGAGTDPRAGWGAGASFSAGASLGAGVRRSLGAGADADPGGGLGADAGAGLGAGRGLGTGGRFGTGASAGTSLGAGADTDPGGGLGTGTDLGPGASFGGVRRLGAGTDPRAAWGTDASGTGARRAGADTDLAAGARVGTGPDAAANPRAITSARASFGAGADSGVSA